MVDYLKHAYERIGATIMAKGTDLFPLFAKAVLVLLCTLLAWAIFKRVLRIVRKKVQRYEFVRIHDEIFVLAQKA
ncbi:MAG: hypothetical protein SWE60_21670, partial [Thermodesulfobacteriota bacterium]|nr:hypothetical protein [Thermodesulfobacteriota bacterium]